MNLQHDAPAPCDHLDSIQPTDYLAIPVLRRLWGMAIYGPSVDLIFPLVLAFDPIWTSGMSEIQATEPRCSRSVSEP